MDGKDAVLFCLCSFFVAAYTVHDDGMNAKLITTSECTDVIVSL